MIINNGLASPRRRDTVDSLVASPSVLATASRWESVGGKPKRERPFFNVFSKEIKFATSGLSADLETSAKGLQACVYWS